MEGGLGSCIRFPDTRLLIDAASLPESAALGRQSRPPTVLDLEETKQKENQLPATQTPSQPLDRRLQAIKALAAARSLV